MNLPTDPKERKQMIVLLCILGMGVLYGIYFVANMLLLKPHKDNVKKLAGLTEDLNKAQGQIKLIPDLRKTNEGHFTEIKAIQDKYVLHDLHGHYRLRAEAFVKEQALAVDVKIIDVKEIGITKFPQPKDEKLPNAEGKVELVTKVNDYAFRTYTARVVVANGLHDMVKLLKQIEEVNPLLCVSSISIAVDTETLPGQHAMSFDIQWPIWLPSEHTEKILADLNSNVAMTVPTGPAKKAGPVVESTTPEKKGKAAVDPKTAEVLQQLGVQE